MVFNTYIIIQCRPTHECMMFKIEDNCLTSILLISVT